MNKMSLAGIVLGAGSVVTAAGSGHLIK